MNDPDAHDQHRDAWGKLLCTRVAASKRRLCRRTRQPWPVGLVQLPDPQSCERHWNDEERTAVAQWRPAPSIKGRAEASATSYADLDLEPACWSWPVPGETVTLLARIQEEGRIDDPTERAMLFGRALRLYDQGRCAVCGLPGNEVEDHDHRTGLVRGWLCRPCNTREGRNPGGAGDVWSRYRARYPYLILGIIEKYVGGWGWTIDRPGDAELYPEPADRWRHNAMRGAFG